MSLDINLTVEKKVKKSQSSGIFIRENGQTKEITEEEWKKRFPDKNPVRIVLEEIETNRVYDGNITHNMGGMADKAGLYYAMWRPEEKGWKLAKDIIPALEFGIGNLKADPIFYKKFNPDNGWGSYEVLLEVAEAYLAACKEYPDAVISVSR